MPTKDDPDIKINFICVRQNDVGIFLSRIDLKKGPTMY